MSKTTGCLYLDNDNTLTLRGLQDIDGREADPETYLNGATVTVTLYEADGTTEVAGETWPLTMTNVPLSDGDYRAILSDAITLAEGREYIARVNADDGPGSRMNEDFLITAKRRRRRAVCVGC